MTKIEENLQLIETHAIFCYILTQEFEKYHKYQ